MSESFVVGERAEVEEWREAGSVDAVGNSSIAEEHGTQEYCAQPIKGLYAGYVRVVRMRRF